MIDRIIARLPGWARTPAEILIKAGEEFGLDRSARMAAAIAYRTIFALAPLLIISVSVAGFVLGGSEAQSQVVDSIESVAGPEIADLLSGVIESALSSANTAALIGFALLFWTASSLFLEVQGDLNDIFDVPTARISGILGLVRARGIGFLWAVGLGLLLLTILALNSLWRFLGGLLPESLEPLRVLVSYLSPLVSILVLPLVFGLVFQTMTAVRVSWRAIWIGGLFTALIFVASAYGVGLYFTLFDEPTALGFAGSLAVVLFLTNLLASVFLFGAQVTKVLADRRGERPLRGRAQAAEEVVMAVEPAPSPPATLVGFLIGLVVGWRRSRR